MTTLSPYQFEGARQIRAFGGRALLADEMGLGKTIQALFYCTKLPHRRPVIVVCPASLKWNWQREAATHMGMTSEILSGRRPYRSLIVQHPIIIINYEILKWWVPFLVRLNPQIVIWDEAHHVKNRETQAFKALRQLLEESGARYRIALSGTPLTNNPSEMWTTLHLLRPDLFQSFNQFAFDHCIPKFARGRWTFPGTKDLDGLHAKLKSYIMIRRLKKDVLPQLPKKFRKVIPIHLEQLARSEYEFARREFLTWLKAISPAKAMRAARNEALVQVGYLLRLVAKLKRFDVKNWIDSFLAESDEKLVVFSGHTKLIDWLMARYSTIAVRLDGQVTGKKRMDAVDAFQTNKQMRLAICNPRAAGVGLNMTAGSHVLYCDFPWHPGILKQGEDRIHRIGQVSKCYIWFLAAMDTIEERLMLLLMEKQSILDQVLDGTNSGGDFDIFKRLLLGELKQAA